MSDINKKAEKLEIIESKIKNNEYTSEIKNTKEFGGADVIISSELTSQNERWIKDQPSVISFQKTIPGKRLVITPYSLELSWLFYQLKDVFKESLDYVSKYDFYGSLAQAAIDFINKSGPEYECNSLLIAVLEEAKRIGE